CCIITICVLFFFQAEDGIRDFHVTGVQTCALPIYPNLSFCSHEVERITENDELLMSSEEKTEVLYFERDKIVQNYFPTLSLVFRNIELGYNEDLLKAFNGDAVLVTLLSVHGGAAHLPFIGARYRVHSKGIYSGEAYLNNMVKSLDSRLI